MMLKADMGHTNSHLSNSGSPIQLDRASPKNIWTTGHNTAITTAPVSSDNAARWAASSLSLATSIPLSYFPEPPTESTDTMDVITASSPNWAGV